MKCVLGFLVFVFAAPLVALAGDDSKEAPDSVILQDVTEVAKYGVPAASALAANKYLDVSGLDTTAIYQSFPDREFQQEDIDKVMHRLEDHHAFSHDLQIFVNDKPVQASLMSEEEFRKNLEIAYEQKQTIKEISVRNPRIRRVSFGLGAIATIGLVVYDLISRGTARSDADRLSDSPSRRIESRNNRFQPTFLPAVRWPWAGQPR